MHDIDFKNCLSIYTVKFIKLSKHVLVMSKIQMIKRKPKENGEKVKPAYFIPIPLILMESLGWKKGDEPLWTILGKDKLKLELKKGGV